jgi:hypothetical protein
VSLLTQVTKGPRPAPPRLVIYGPGGVGKTTFAAGAPSPILIRTEDGLGTLDVPALPVAKKYTEIHNYLLAILNDEHDYKTLIMDSLDHLEPLIWADTCALNGKKSIEEFGYGKGYVEALQFWRQFFAILSEIRDRRRMAIILIAHHEIKSYQDPTQDPYDRYQIKLHKSASALALEWADATLFASYRVHAVEGNGGRVRGMGSGERILLTEERPSHVAKNRWGLPYELPLSFRDFAAAFAAATTKPAAQPAETKGNP